MTDHATESKTANSTSAAEALELKQLRQIFNNVHELIWVLTLAGPEGPYFSFVSENHLDQLGNNTEPILGMSLQKFIEKFVHEDDWHIYAARAKNRGKIQPDEFTTRIRRADNGEIRWMRVRTFPIIEDDGSYKRSVGLVEDVTDRKQLEESLENERAIRIGSAKMAAIGLLAAEIAHEINNPLQIIQGYASRATSILRLSAPNESEFIEKYSNSVNRAVTQIATIVKGLLTYSRNASLDPMQMSAIADPIDMTVAMVKHLSAKHGIELSISGIDPSSIEIECRTGQIVQVLYNLLLNAIDAVKEAKEKWIKVDLSFLPGDERLQIRVINSGTLIDANILQEITKPFFTTKPAGKGTGLGLYITKGIIESHNGRLWHEDGQANTTFVVELPCRKTDQLIS